MPFSLTGLSGLWHLSRFRSVDADACHMNCILLLRGSIRHIRSISQLVRQSISRSSCHWCCHVCTTVAWRNLPSCATPVLYRSRNYMTTWLDFYVNCWAACSGTYRVTAHVACCHYVLAVYLADDRHRATGRFTLGHSLGLAHNDKLWFIFRIFLVFFCQPVKLDVVLPTAAIADV